MIRTWSWPRLRIRPYIEHETPGCATSGIARCGIRDRQLRANGKGLTVVVIRHGDVTVILGDPKRAGQTKGKTPEIYEVRAVKQPINVRDGVHPGVYLMLLIRSRRGRHPPEEYESRGKQHQQALHRVLLYKRVFKGLDIIPVTPKIPRDSERPNGRPLVVRPATTCIGTCSACVGIFFIERQKIRTVTAAKKTDLVGRRYV